MDDDSTPPTGSPALRSLPTIGTVQAQVDANGETLGLVGADVAAVRRDVELIRRHLLGDPDVIRLSPLPTPSQLAPPAVPTERRPSLAVQAANATMKGTGKLGRFIVIATAALSIAGQIAALWEPRYTGPIVQALQLLAAFGGAEAPP